MTAEPSSGESALLPLLEAAAERHWGSRRRGALAPGLARTAQALATVDTFPLPWDAEPFPTGPEPPGKREARGAERGMEWDEMGAPRA